MRRWIAQQSAGAPTLFKDVLIASGCAVSGGSLGYATTLYIPGREFFHDPHWRGLEDWEAALAPHYAEAQLLGTRLLTAPVRPRRSRPRRTLAHIQADRATNASRKCHPSPPALC